LTYFRSWGTLVRETSGGGLMSVTHYDSYTDARAHLKDLLDAAERGRVATVRRDAGRTAVVDVERLRTSLATLSPSRAQVVAEGGGWSVFIPGLPVAADGATFEEAIVEMIDALREYAEDWQERLLDAPNHRNNWGLVQLISLSTDDQLRDWLVGPGR
jgi:predicted RNase H-like HicB family nuclease